MTLKKMMSLVTSYKFTTHATGHRLSVVNPETGVTTAFNWLPEWELPDWATGRLYFFVTLGSTVMLNKVVFGRHQNCIN